MKKIIAGASATFAFVAGLVTVAPAPAANATDVGVDMNQACQIQHGALWQAKLLDPGNAYSWRCRS